MRSEMGLGAWTIQRGSEGQIIGLGRIISECYRATDLNLPYFVCLRFWLDYSLERISFEAQ